MAENGLRPRCSVFHNHLNLVNLEIYQMERIENLTWLTLFSIETTYLGSLAAKCR